MSTVVTTTSYTPQEISVKTKLNEEFLIDIIETNKNIFRTEIIKKIITQDSNHTYDKISNSDKAYQNFEDAIIWINNHIIKSDQIIEVANIGACQFISLIDEQNIINSLNLNITVIKY
jgi:hypothetical protein